MNNFLFDPPPLVGCWTYEQYIRKAESRKQKWGTPAAPEWWAMAPVGERRFLDGLARMMRSARRSKSPGVALAALKWERALACFIKVRLITEKQKAESGKQKWERKTARPLDYGTTDYETIDHVPRDHGTTGEKQKR